MKGRFSPRFADEVRRGYKSGPPPSSLMRSVFVRQSMSVPDLMMIIEDAFGLAFEDTTCIGGWWHDGTGELSDEQVDAFLVPAIEQRGRLTLPKPRPTAVDEPILSAPARGKVSLTEDAAAHRFMRAAVDVGLERAKKLLASLERDLDKLLR